MKGKVLVVDDDRSMTDLLSERLKRRQFDNRSDLTKLVSSAGNRRRVSKTKERFMGER